MRLHAPALPNSLMETAERILNAVGSFIAAKLASHVRAASTCRKLLVPELN
jgi:hypothetical protein